MSLKIEMFNESVGYEVYLLINSLKEVGRTSGLSEGSGISFVSHSYTTHTMTLSDRIGGSLVPEFIIKNLLPMVFTSSFKILDMFMEYLIRINNIDLPWQFSKKINLIDESIDSMIYPDKFDGKMAGDLFHLYKELVKYRNMIIHGAWGEFKEEKMIFKKDDKTFEMSKEEILALSNIAQIIVGMLNNDSDTIYMDGYKATFGRDMNKFADKFGDGYEKYPELFIIYHEVHYLLNEDDEDKIVIPVIMKNINSELEANRRFYPSQEFEIVFEVIVEKEGQVWKIPSNKLPLDEEEVLLEEFKNFII